MGCTIKALIKALLKIITIRKGTLFGAKKIFRTLRGTFELQRNWDLSNRTYNGQATTGQGEGVGCGLGLKYALILAAVVSEVEIIQQQLK